jgi:hypothetical protein
VITASKDVQQAKKLEKELQRKPLELKYFPSLEAAKSFLVKLIESSGQSLLRFVARPPLPIVFLSVFPFSRCPLFCCCFLVSETTKASSTETKESKTSSSSTPAPIPEDEAAEIPMWLKAGLLFVEQQLFEQTRIKQINSQFEAQLTKIKKQREDLRTKNKQT